MGSIVQRNVAHVFALNNVTILMGLVWKDVTWDSMDLIVLKVIQCSTINLLN